MEAAVGAASWLLGKVLTKLSNDLVASYVFSSELGLNFQAMVRELMYTQGLLHAAEGRHISSNPGLQGLLEDLGGKANEAEDALDELHYFMIQDELDGTREAAPDLGDGLRGQARDARHAVQHTTGNWFSCFPCCRSQDDVVDVTDDTHNTSNITHSTRSDGPIDKLIFNRVDMSNRIKQLLEDMQDLCPRISTLLTVNNPNSSSQSSIAAFTKRPATSSAIIQEKLFGRDEIFEKTINEIISATQNSTILSVLPIVGPGGIGKTTFTQHLFNDKRAEAHFSVRVWLCVSTSFDVLKLTKEILSCLPAAQNGEDKIQNEPTNLDQLQKYIALRLKSTRFLIVFDDIWECDSTDEWEKLLAPFKKGDTNGNMVLVTTRYPKIGEMVTKATVPIHLHGLEPDEFWKFFQVCVFGENQDEHGNGDLTGIARQIADKLKCSPLAAKTVGRLLNKKQCREHWIEILQKKEWLNQKHVNDIIPALRISYDYLPFSLKKCFHYCALFPEDYKFNSLEIGCFFISIGITDSSDQNDKTEDIGSKCLDELLDNGFMMKADDNHYVMHDLLHELSESVSSKECAFINCSSFKADGVPSSIRHLSISIQDEYIENFDVEMDKLKRRIDVGNLRSLMIFGEYRRANIVNILKSTFEDIKCLRVLFISMISPNSLPHNFSRLVHLRYLKIQSPDDSSVCLPGTVSRFYHLKFLDLQKWGWCCDLPMDISRLVNLCHFIAKGNFHCNVPKVGKMKLLQELKKFHVKKDSVGFELRELGQLEHLGGELHIYGLENVENKEAANEAKLMEKRNLVKLGLAWDKEYPSTGVDVVDNLQPHSNLRELCIVNHRGATCPSWLRSNIQLKNLETLDLKGVSWATLPPIGHIYHLRILKLRDIAGICQFGTDFFGGVTEASFRRLKEVEFCVMPELVEWVERANAHLFSSLERIKCYGCPKLAVLPLSGWSGYSEQQKITCFPNLRHLYTLECPMLCLPPLPHTPRLSSFETDCLNYNGTFLEIKMPCEIAFQNLGEVKDLKIGKVSLVSFTDLQKLHPLRWIYVSECEEISLRWLDDGVALHSVQSLSVSRFPVTGKSLSNLFKCFPALYQLHVHASDGDHEEVVLQFPPSCSLSSVSFSSCRNLTLPVEDGSGFQGLSSLQSVEISRCGRIFSRWLMGGEATESSRRPFPPCLKHLFLFHEPSASSMALLSNLTSLTTLELVGCRNLSVDGFNPLITSSLETLRAYNHEDDECSVAADLLVEMARTTAITSFQLTYILVDSISAVLVAPICSLLSATLRKLIFYDDCRVESFTEEQDQALQLLTSLVSLEFHSCSALQSLPQVLHGLPSLNTLQITGSPKIRSLPKKGLPDSLRSFYIYIEGCCAELEEECHKLGDAWPDINIYVRR